MIQLSFSHPGVKHIIIYTKYDHWHPGVKLSECFFFFFEGRWGGVGKKGWALGIHHVWKPVITWLKMFAKNRPPTFLGKMYLENQLLLVSINFTPKTSLTVA